MRDIQEKRVSCPYCGEHNYVLLDPSVPHQNYIEDCQVCCKPMIFDVKVGEDEVFVSLKSEDD